MDDQSVAQVTSALRVVHDPTTPGNARAEAQQLLDSLKSRQDAPLLGCALAQPSHDGIVRHFGLSLLQSSLHAQISSMDAASINTIRQWVMELAASVDESTPHYIKEKIAFSWVYLTKRIWSSSKLGDGWRSMDSDLLALWSRGDSASQEFVLSVLRNLYEDVYLLDDPIAMSRGHHFSVLCSSVLLSADQVRETHGPDTFEDFRSSPDGWFHRWAQLMAYCIENTGSSRNQKVLVRLLDTFKSVVAWVSPLAIEQNELINLLMGCLKNSDVQIRVLACDNLHILLCRRYTDPEDFSRVVSKLLSVESMQWISSIYQSIRIDPKNVDDLEYVFLKKIIELVIALGEQLESPKRKVKLESDTGMNEFFQLVLEITVHPSLLASGLSLQFWCSLLRLESTDFPVKDLLPRLLEIACSRCIHYEHTPEDSDARLFMDYDFNSNQEARVFYGNYRRYMEDIIRLSVCQIPIPALNFLHQHFTSFFESSMGNEAMHSKTLETTDAAHIFGCAQIDIVEAGIRGVSRWQLCQVPQRDVEEPQVMDMVTQWALEMIGLYSKDTVLYRKIIECMVQFAPLFAKQNDSQRILFQILEKVLKACTYELPPETLENEEARSKVIDLRTASGTELNRLAYMIPEALMQIYDELENVIGQLLSSGDVREHEAVLFKSFLLVVSQRSSLGDKTSRFARIVDPALSSWTDEGTVKGLSDLEWFMERVGIVRIAQYFQSRGITSETNLLATQMDDEGRKLKSELTRRWQAIFPIRATRIFIQYPIEKLDHSSPEYQHLLSVWKPRVKVFLPHILQLVSQISAYHNPANWTTLPPEVQTFVSVSCKERFWQVGVSMQSKDEFERESLEASKTLRDFADSVGHIVRYTREYAFLTLGSISQLEETMYEIDGMGNMLYQAIAGQNTPGITSHCWRHTISIVVRNVVKNCPPEYMQQFLPPFISQFLMKLDEVLVGKWNTITANGYQLMDDDMIENFDSEEQSLSDEMMAEHLLRQLTAITVRLLIDLVKLDSTNRHKRLVRDVALANGDMLLAVLTLCRHIMGYKDSRCCFNVCLILRDLVYYKAIPKDPVIRSYISQEIIPGLLSVFFDPYFHESIGEVGVIFAFMFEDTPELISDAFEALGDPKNAPTFEEFKEAIRISPSSDQRRGMILEFLNGFKDSSDEESSRKKLLKRVQQQQQRTSNRPKPNFEDSYDTAAAINLFGDTDY